MLTWSGWRFVRARSAGSVHATSQAYVGDGDGVSWCRTVRSGSAYRAACTALDTKKLRWKRAVVSSTSRSLATVNRGWLDTAAGPALCGRAGTEKGQRVGCHVLTESGWTWTRSARRSPWGHADYRAFLPTADGVSFCRTRRQGLGRLHRTRRVPVVGRHREVCPHRPDLRRPVLSGSATSASARAWPRSRHSAA